MPLNNFNLEGQEVYKEFYIKYKKKVDKKLYKKGYSTSEVSILESKYLVSAFEHVLGKQVVKNVNNCVVSLFLGTVIDNNLVETYKYVKSVYNDNRGLSVKRLAILILNDKLPDVVVAEAIANSLESKGVVKKVIKYILKCNKKEKGVA